MNCRWRYTLAFFTLIIILMCLYAALTLRTNHQTDVPTGKQKESIAKSSTKRSSFLSVNDEFSEVIDGVRASHGGIRLTGGPGVGVRLAGGRIAYADCRMSNCFDISRCRQEFKVYVYPPDRTSRPVSSSYAQILKALQASRYYTSDPSEACLFVLSLDTLDRDRLSADYVPDMQQRLEQLEWWRNGTNHIIFNLYSGTWPDYDENGLAFDVGSAMLAKASLSTLNSRPGFDVSLPLFHKEHPFRGVPRNESTYQASNSVPPLRRYILSFKGKRYLSGIGSEVRNSLYHIHNGADIILLTTCKHGKGWKAMEDERCERDNAEYDKYMWDYKVLLKNSTFCLVPRGRRLGSYRFLEALQAGCVPVLLSNDWVLPFSDVIDWSRAVVWGDERLLLQIPSITRSVSHADLLSLRQQTQFLYDAYFSSIENIVFTTLEIIKERVSQQFSRSSVVWNTPPGAAFVLPEFSQSLSHFPFYYKHLGLTPGRGLIQPGKGLIQPGQGLKQPGRKEKPSKSQSRHGAGQHGGGVVGERGLGFTAVIKASLRSVRGQGSYNTTLHQLMRQMSKCPSLHAVLVLWINDDDSYVDIRGSEFSHVLSSLQSLIRPLSLSHKVITSVGEQFGIYDDVQTDAVLSVDERSVIIADEIELGMSIWREFSDRLIGYTARGHVWDDRKSRWSYSSKPTNDYSIILTHAAFYHRYYGYLYHTILPSSVKDLVNRYGVCEDILLNFLISHITKLPPIKIGQRDILLSSEKSYASILASSSQSHASGVLNSQSQPSIGNSNQSGVLKDFGLTNHVKDMFQWPLNKNDYKGTRLKRDTRTNNYQDNNNNNNANNNNSYNNNNSDNNININNINMHNNSNIKDNLKGGTADSRRGRGEEFKRRCDCVNRFTQEFGYMPLRRTAFRLDPLLFKDPVSVVRKKYRLMDTVT